MNDNKKHIEVTEHFNINDTKTEAPIVGIVSIYDENGKLIQEKHNMVVKSGRNMLFKLFKSYFQASDIKANAELFLNLSYNTPYVQTTPDLKLENINSILKKSYKINMDPTADNSNESDLILSISQTVEAGTTSFSFNQIYLTVKSGEAENLFSRVGIDPVYLSANSSYTLTYKLYF